MKAQNWPWHLLLLPPEICEKIHTPDNNNINNHNTNNDDDDDDDYNNDDDFI